MWKILTNQSLTKRRYIFCLSEHKKDRSVIGQSARDWILINAEHQLFIASVCQSCVGKSERA